MIASKIKSLYNNDVKNEEIIAAALADDNDLVSSLLSNGVDVNTEYEGFTALHIACMHGNAPLVEIILGHDKNAQKVDFSVRTTERSLLSWQLALENRHFELAERVAVAARANAPRLHLSP